MIRTIASDTLWEKKEKKKKREKKKGRFDFGFLPSVLQAEWGLHVDTRGPLLPFPTPRGGDGREKEGRGRFPHPFPSAPSNGTGHGFGTGGRRGRNWQKSQRCSHRRAALGSF